MGPKTRAAGAVLLAIGIGEVAGWVAMRVGADGRFTHDTIVLGTFATLSPLFRRWLGVRHSPYAEPSSVLKP